MNTKHLIGIPAMLLVFGLASAAVGQTTERVSVDSAGVEGDSVSLRPFISADGRFVAFDSSASNLVVGDTNGTSDIFVHDRQTGTTERVSVDSAGSEGNAISVGAFTTADGRFVAFSSFASNLVASDTNDKRDVFVHDRQTGATTRVSVDSAGAQGNIDSGAASISADGRFVGFASPASNLVIGDTNGESDVFVHDRQTGATELVSVDGTGAQGNAGSFASSISADGRFVAFDSTASNLVVGDTNGAFDVFVHDRQADTTALVSVDSAGTPGNLRSFAPSISADGRFVAFTSNATNLVADDTNGELDVFVHDRQTGATERISVGTSGNLVNFRSSISADGRIVAFFSFASNLVPDDTNGAFDVFVHDRQTGTTTRVSVNNAGAQGNLNSFDASISGDGRFVAFNSIADNLVAGDTNNAFDVFVHDRGPTNQPPSSRPSPPAALRLGPR